MRQCIVNYAHDLSRYIWFVVTQETTSLRNENRKKRNSNILLFSLFKLSIMRSLEGEIPPLPTVAH